MKNSDLSQKTQEILDAADGRKAKCFIGFTGEEIAVALDYYFRVLSDKPYDYTLEDLRQAGAEMEEKLSPFVWKCAGQS